MAVTLTEKGQSSFGCRFFTFSGAPVQSLVPPYSRGTRVIHSHIRPRVSNVAELIGGKAAFLDHFLHMRKFAYL